MPAQVVAVSASATHSFSKGVCASITLVRGLGVADDAHSGATVKHRSRVARNPAQPNLRQVHLMHGELFDELALRGFVIAPGQLGENITTAGVDLLALPRDTLLRVGAAAVLRITGLRNPCGQLDRFQAGLMSAVLERAPDGALIRKAGIMAVVEHGGIVCAGDAIEVQLPPPPHRPLEPV
jgi:MOSC domain-containing protein YiiM